MSWESGTGMALHETATGKWTGSDGEAGGSDGAALGFEA
jgi:hypothetical protein